MGKSGLCVLSSVVLLWLAGCTVEKPLPALQTSPAEEFGTPLIPIEPGELEDFEGEPDAGAGVKGLLIERAVADLAAKLEVTREAVEVVYVDAVEWPDAGLGCPEPGMMYTQVITPGYRLELQVEGESYWYHADNGTLIIQCGEDGTWLLPPIPFQPGEKIQDGEPWMPVD